MQCGIPKRHCNHGIPLQYSSQNRGSSKIRQKGHRLGKQRSNYIRRKRQKGEKSVSDRRLRISSSKIPCNQEDNNPALFVSNKQPHTRLGKQAIQSMLRTLGNKTEIHAHPHKFRRTLLTDAGNRGIPLQEIQMYAGHQKPDTTMMYVTVSEENVKASFRRYIS